MRKSISISIRVSEEELDKFKEAAEAARIIKENNEGEDTHEHN